MFYKMRHELFFVFSDGCAEKFPKKSERISLRFFVPFRALNFYLFALDLILNILIINKLQVAWLLFFIVIEKNIVFRWFGLVLCGYSTKLANNGKWSF